MYNLGSIKYNEGDLCVWGRAGKEINIELKNNCSNKKWKILIQTYNERKKLPVPIFVQERVKKIAISILITKDPDVHSGFLDSAGALVMSIRETKLSYDYDLIAIVTQFNYRYDVYSKLITN